MKKYHPIQRFFKTPNSVNATIINNRILYLEQEIDKRKADRKGWYDKTADKFDRNNKNYGFEK